MAIDSKDTKVKTPEEAKVVDTKPSYKGRIFLLLLLSYFSYTVYAYIYDKVLIIYILEALSRGEHISYYEEIPRFFDMLWFFEAYDNFMNVMDPFLRSIPAQMDSYVIRSLVTQKTMVGESFNYSNSFFMDLAICWYELKTIIGFTPFTGLQFVYYIERLFDIDHMYIGVHIPYPRYEDIETHYFYRMLSNVFLIILCDYEEFEELYLGVWEFLPKDYYFLGHEIKALPFVFKISLILGFFFTCLTIFGEPSTTIEGFFDFYSAYVENLVLAFDGPLQVLIILIAFMAIISLGLVSLVLFLWKSLMLIYGFLIYYVIAPFISFILSARFLVLLFLDSFITFHNNQTSDFWIYASIIFAVFLFIVGTIVSIVSFIYLADRRVGNIKRYFYTTSSLLPYIPTSIKNLRAKMIPDILLCYDLTFHCPDSRLTKESAHATQMFLMQEFKRCFKNPSLESLLILAEFADLLRMYLIFTYWEPFVIKMHKKWEEFLKLPETRKREREIQAGLYYDEEKARKRLLNNKWWNTEVYVIPMTKRELAHLGTLKRGSTARYEYIESFKFYNLHYTDYSYFLMNIGTFIAPIPFVLTNNLVVIFNYLRDTMMRDNCMPISTYRTHNYGPRQHLLVKKYRSRFVNYRGTYHKDANLLMGDEMYTYEALAFRLQPKKSRRWLRYNHSVNFFDDKYRMGKKRKIRNIFPEHDTSEWRVYSYPHFSQILTKEGAVDGMGMDINDATSNAEAGMQQFFTTYEAIRMETLEKCVLPLLMALGILCVMSLFANPRIIFKYWGAGLIFPYMFLTHYWNNYEINIDSFQALLQWMDAECVVVHPEDFNSEERADGDTADMFEEWTPLWREFTATQTPEMEFGYRVVELLKDEDYFYIRDNFTWRMTKYMEGKIYRGRLFEWDQLMRVHSGNKRMGGLHTIYATKCYMRMQYYTTQYSYNWFMHAEKRIPRLDSKDMTLVRYRTSKKNLGRVYIMQYINPKLVFSKFHPDHGTLNKEPDVTMHNSMEIQRLAKTDPRMIRDRIVNPLRSGPKIDYSKVNR